MTPYIDTAGKAFWDDTWANYRPQVYPGPIFEFHKLYSTYLPHDNQMTFVEIGAMPGNHMVYFNKEFGYRVTGIDYCSDVAAITATMHINGIHEYALINADVFSLKDAAQYDVVFSSGFVEHFEDYETVLALHSRMVKLGGYLLITVPNTKYLHKVLMKIFCPEIYQVHRDYLMSRSVLRAGVEKLGFEVMYCDYLKTFRPFYPLPGPIRFGARIVNKLLRLLRLDNIPNALASPYLYLIAKKVR